MRILASPAHSHYEVNPYTALLYQNISGAEVAEYSHRKAIFGNYDILHFHWPDGYIAASGLLKSLQRIAVLAFVVLWTRLKGTRIIWTVHNLAPHDSRFPCLSENFLHWFARRCHGFICLSQDSFSQFSRAYPLAHTQKYAVIPHGDYRSVYPHVPSRDTARAKLGVPQEAHVLMFFGMLKRYKNVAELVDCFTALNKPGMVLVIAGSTGDWDLQEELARKSAQNPSIHLFIKFVPHEDVPLFFAAADKIILPFRRILNSGSAMLALSFNRPVLAPALGSLKELQKEVGAQWVHLYDGDFRTDYLEKFIDSGLPSPPQAPLDSYAWPLIGAKTLAFYQEVVGQKS